MTNVYPIIDLGPRYPSVEEIIAGRQTAFVRYGRHLWELGETILYTVDDVLEHKVCVRVLHVIRCELRDLPARVCIQSGSSSHDEARIELERWGLEASPRRNTGMGTTRVTVSLSSRVTAMTFETLRD